MRLCNLTPEEEKAHGKWKRNKTKGRIRQKSDVEEEKRTIEVARFKEEEYLQIWEKISKQHQISVCLYVNKWVW